MDKLIKCRICSGEIAETAKICPHCGAERRLLERQPLEMAIICVACLVFIPLIFAIVYGGGTAPSSAPAITITQSSPEPAVVESIVYEDEKMKISYQGIAESMQPWMTERGMEEILVQGVNLKITNYTENSFFVGGSTLLVDGVDVSPVSATLNIWAEGTDEYIYYAEKLSNLQPANIEMDLYVFDIHEPQIFEPYEIQLDFSVEY